jgi:geranylgeranyl pyrophosphate synthase
LATPADETQAARNTGTALPPRDISRLKRVPEPRQVRDLLKQRCAMAARELDHSSPVDEIVLAELGERVLAELRLPREYLGWTMVALASGIWRDRVAAVPYEQRLFLLPTGDKVLPINAATNGNGHAAPADDLRRRAQELGYQVAAIDRSEALLKLILGGSVRAIVGVASLDLLERALDKILAAGIPCMAVPLLDAGGKEFAVDTDWVLDMLRTQPSTQPGMPRSASGPSIAPNGYVDLLRRARAMFDPAELSRLAPRIHKQPLPASSNGAAASLDPLAGTEAIAYDFLARGGKYSRPFITLAVYEALTRGTNGRGTHGAALPDAVLRAAISIETFHKASLVHDDIEDDDDYRYGTLTLHRKFGQATAINVGDYLIGLGYRLVSRESRTLGPEVVADILDRLADAHMRLCEGQGAELLWRDAKSKQLSPADALRIYELKTAPAFEAALFTGARIAGPDEAYRTALAQFARSLGVAFQILNDLGDWHEGSHNKLLACGDVLGGRPTVLWALALERLPPADRASLEAIAAQTPATRATIQQVRAYYDQANVFEAAASLVDEYRRQAEAIASTVEPEPLRRLLTYLVGAVLDASTSAAPLPEPLPEPACV